MSVTLLPKMPFGDAGIPLPLPPPAMVSPVAGAPTACCRGKLCRASGGTAGGCVDGTRSRSPSWADIPARLGVCMSMPQEASSPLPGAAAICCRDTSSLAALAAFPPLLVCEMLAGLPVNAAFSLPGVGTGGGVVAGVRCAVAAPQAAARIDAAS
jgi:hypothetical protein